jgi:outer membrane receptor protein involved in Fe transport
MPAAFALSLGLLVDLLTAQPVGAAERRYTFNVPAVGAASALATVATVTGYAIGWPGGLPAIRLRPLRGAMTVSDALHALLEGTGYIAERVGPTAFRIIRAPPLFVLHAETAKRLPQAPLKPSLIVVPGLLPAPAEIVVTGQKQPQVLRDVPLSVSVVMLEEPRIGILQPGSRDVFDLIEGVAITNLGAGRNRQFIRGVADSPFNGPSQSTVAVQLDEARVTYDAPDPDLRLIDMQRVEVLKGPQGALYGSGTLGGIYHLVTRRPELEEFSAMTHVGAEAVADGGIGAAGDATINVPIIADRLAVRAVGYGAREAGWIDDIGGRADANLARVFGGRAAVRLQATQDWSLDVSGALQNVYTRDSQYVTVSPETLWRVAPRPEPTDNTFKSLAATINGRIGPVEVLATTSHVWQHVDTTLDSTAASAMFRILEPTTFYDNRTYEIANYEVRLSSDTPARWLVGASYLDARSDATGSIASQTIQAVVETRIRRVREYAGFAEITMPLFAGVTGVVGARLSRSLTADVAASRTGGSVDSTSTTQFAPSGAISWKPDERSIIYLRYARAIRPGGLAPTGGALGEVPATNRPRTRQFASDELGTFDLGLRRNAASGRLALVANVFATDWRHVQTDYLLTNGLISTRNAGRARIRGVEASAELRPTDAWLVSLGMAYVDARLVRDEEGNLLSHRRLPVTPDLTGRARAQFGFDLAGWEAKVDAQVNYVGTSWLSFDPPFNRKMGDYATVSAGAVASRSRYAFSARIDNLLDARGNSFAFGNPFSLANAQQYTPQRPRTISLSIARSW